MALVAIGEPLATLHEHLGRLERGLARGGELVEPDVVARIDAVVVEHERAVVGVERDRQLGDVAIVDAPARDAFALGPLAEVPRVLLHAIREHLGQRHRYTPATPR